MPASPRVHLLDQSELSDVTQYKSDILSSAAWSAVIHHPAEDSEPDELPSTVDIDAIKEPATPLPAPCTPGGTNENYDVSDDPDSESTSDDPDSDSESDTDSEEEGEEEGSRDTWSESESESASEEEDGAGTRRRRSSSSSEEEEKKVSENYYRSRQPDPSNPMKVKISAMKHKSTDRKASSHSSDEESSREVEEEECQKERKRSAQKPSCSLENVSPVRLSSAIDTLQSDRDSLRSAAAAFHRSNRNSYQGSSNSVSGRTVTSRRRESPFKTRTACGFNRTEEVSSCSSGDSRTVTSGSGDSRTVTSRTSSHRDSPSKMEELKLLNSAKCSSNSDSRTVTSRTSSHRDSPQDMNSRKISNSDSRTVTSRTSSHRDSPNDMNSGKVSNSDLRTVTSRTSSHRDSPSKMEGLNSLNSAKCSSNSDSRTVTSRSNRDSPQDMNIRKVSNSDSRTVTSRTSSHLDFARKVEDKCGSNGDSRTVTSRSRSKYDDCGGVFKNMNGTDSTRAVRRKIVREAEGERETNGRTVTPTRKETISSSIRLRSSRRQPTETLTSTISGAKQRNAASVATQVTESSSNDEEGDDVEEEEEEDQEEEKEKSDRELEKDEMTQLDRPSSTLSISEHLQVKKIKIQFILLHFNELRIVMFLIYDVFCVQAASVATQVTESSSNDEEGDDVEEEEEEDQEEEKEKSDRELEKDEMTQLDRPSSTLSISEHLQVINQEDLAAILPDVGGNEFLGKGASGGGGVGGGGRRRSKGEGGGRAVESGGGGDSSTSSSDNETLPDVSDVINQITSDQSDHDVSKMAADDGDDDDDHADDDADSEVDEVGGYSSKLLQRFNQQTEQLSSINADLTTRRGGTDVVEMEGGGGEEGGGGGGGYCQVSPDSGIQSVNGSPAHAQTTSEPIANIAKLYTRSNELQGGERGKRGPGRPSKSSDKKKWRKERDHQLKVPPFYKKKQQLDNELPQLYGANRRGPGRPKKSPPILEPNLPSSSQKRNHKHRHHHHHHRHHHHRHHHQQTESNSSSTLLLNEICEQVSKRLDIAAVEDTIKELPPVVAAINGRLKHKSKLHHHHHHHHHTSTVKNASLKNGERKRIVALPKSIAIRSHRHKKRKKARKSVQVDALKTDPRFLVDLDQLVVVFEKLCHIKPPVKPVSATTTKSDVKPVSAVSTKLCHTKSDVKLGSATTSKLCHTKSDVKPVSATTSKLCHTKSDVKPVSASTTKLCHSKSDVKPVSASTTKLCHTKSDVKPGSATTTKLCHTKSDVKPGSATTSKLCHTKSDVKPGSATTSKLCQTKSPKPDVKPVSATTSEADTSKTSVPPVSSKSSKSKKRKDREQSNEVVVAAEVPVQQQQQLLSAGVVATVKRRPKKAAVETPKSRSDKLEPANNEQRLPLKKRHYHMSSSTTPHLESSSPDSDIAVDTHITPPAQHMVEKSENLGTDSIDEAIEACINKYGGASVIATPKKRHRPDSDTATTVQVKSGANSVSNSSSTQATNKRVSSSVANSSSQPTNKRVSSRSLSQSCTVTAAAAKVVTVTAVTAPAGKRASCRVTAPPLVTAPVTSAATKRVSARSSSAVECGSANANANATPKRSSSRVTKRGAITRCSVDVSSESTDQPLITPIPDEAPKCSKSRAAHKPPPAGVFEPSTKIDDLVSLPKIATKIDQLVSLPKITPPPIKTSVCQVINKLTERLKGLDERNKVPERVKSGLDDRSKVTEREKDKITERVKGSLDDRNKVPERVKGGLDEKSKLTDRVKGQDQSCTSDADASVFRNLRTKRANPSEDGKISQVDVKSVSSSIPDEVDVEKSEKPKLLDCLLVSDEDKSKKRKLIRDVRVHVTKLLPSDLVVTTCKPVVDVPAAKPKVKRRKAINRTGFPVKKKKKKKVEQVIREEEGTLGPPQLEDQTKMVACMQFDETPALSPVSLSPKRESARQRINNKKSSNSTLNTSSTTCDTMSDIKALVSQLKERKLRNKEELDVNTDEQQASLITIKDSNLIKDKILTDEEKNDFNKDEQLLVTANVTDKKLGDNEEPTNEQLISIDEKNLEDSAFIDSGKMKSNKGSWGLENVESSDNVVKQEAINVINNRKRRDKEDLVLNKDEMITNKDSNVINSKKQRRDKKKLELNKDEIMKNKDSDVINSKKQRRDKKELEVNKDELITNKDGDVVSSKEQRRDKEVNKDEALKTDNVMIDSVMKGKKRRDLDVDRGELKVNKDNVTKERKRRGKEDRECVNEGVKEEGVEEKVEEVARKVEEEKETRKEEAVLVVTSRRSTRKVGTEERKEESEMKENVVGKREEKRVTAERKSLKDITDRKQKGKGKEVGVAVEKEKEEEKEKEDEEEKEESVVQKKITRKLAKDTDENGEKEGGCVEKRPRLELEKRVRHKSQRSQRLRLRDKAEASKRRKRKRNGVRRGRTKRMRSIEEGVGEKEGEREGDPLPSTASDLEEEQKVGGGLGGGGGVGEGRKRAFVPRWRKRYLTAGLFSDVYKRGGRQDGGDHSHERDRDRDRDRDWRVYRPDEHRYGLMPAPIYCAKWVRQRRVHFQLPHDLWWLHKHSRLPGRDVVPSWNHKKIRTNVYYDVKPSYMYEAQACNCNLPPAQGVQGGQGGKPPPGCGEDCINRLIYTECSPRLCPCKQHCSNQRIQRHEWAPGLVKFMTADKGWGVKTRHPIRTGEFILEYVGEVVSEREFKSRMASRYHSDTHHYCLHLDGGLVIDGHRMGGDGRFVNHSCEPNCEMQKWSVNGLFRMALFALRDIRPHEELTYDYNFALFNPKEGQPCLCKSSRCRGVIGGKYQRLNQVLVNKESQDNSAATKPRKKSRKGQVDAKQQQQQQQDKNAVGSTAKETQASSCQVGSTGSLQPPKPLTATQQQLVASTRLFLLRNFAKVKRCREKLKQAVETTRNDESNAAGARNVRARRPVHATNSNAQQTRVVELTESLEALYGALVSAKDDKGEPLATPLMTMPSKRRNETPIDLNTIDSRIKSGHYQSLQEFDTDMNRLLANAVRYYGRSSQMVAVTEQLKDVYTAAKRGVLPQIDAELGEPPSVSSPLHNQAGCDDNEDDKEEEGVEEKEEDEVEEKVKEGEEEEVIRCVCGILRDEGLMIQCEKCMVWQHCDCVKADPGVEHYLCEQCHTRPVDREIKYDTNPPYAQPGQTHYMTLMRGQLQIRQGDTVYVLRDIPNEETGTKHNYKTIKVIDYNDCDIFRIERLWKDEKGDRFVFGHHYLRPHETYHEPTRKFYLNEVMRVPLYEVVSIDLVMAHCYVLDPNTYCKGRPRDAVMEHVYICEYRVDKGARLFAKLARAKQPPVCTKAYAFHTYAQRLKISRTYTPHGPPPSTSSVSGGKTSTAHDLEQQGSSVTLSSNATVAKSNATATKSNIAVAKSNATVTKSNATAAKSNATAAKSNAVAAKSNATAVKSNAALTVCNVTNNSSQTDVTRLPMAARRGDQKQRVNSIALRLLARAPSKQPPLDLSYLLEPSRRNRKRPALLCP
ncbi:LOW QUALITY PROTEIN: uncharacterized protein LOC111050219 [Nilaparvata lugens]|uniref:LOW QUALITY PROTEIN: uncharacterized protein LOC111050219 n=1 Tax=Nilaparvata lugens TaxID=108931 RepID=UPI00193CC290|nr:LOW QUALITY PROTEIN: uncharacterized protein LOC111050219 [Nilaparvata lugens]